VKHSTASISVLGLIFSENIFKTWKLPWI